MAGTSTKKRSHDGRPARPSKKQKKQSQYHSDSDEDARDDFDAVDLLDSDEEGIHTAAVDDGAASGEEQSNSDEGGDARRTKQSKPQGKARRDESDDSESDWDDEFDGLDNGARQRMRSKRNDPSAFATSLSKILSTKLSTSRRADPVLARSAAAHDAAKAAVDSALESKARKQMREQKKLASEKGRVRDVLVATRNEVTGEAEGTTGEILEVERRLRKVAQRGVVKLFNAVRGAQVKAAETERSTKKDGVIGVVRREEKVNEMSKKGFLELIASGGGGLKQGALEEA